MHRDDHEAALARVVALERELAAARECSSVREEQLQLLQAELEQLKEKLALLAEKKKGRKARTPPDATWLRRNWLYLVFIGPVVLGIIAAPIIKLLYERHRARAGPGELIEAHPARGSSGGDLLVLLSRVYHEGRTFTRESWRLDVIDPRRGRRIARHLFDDEERGQRVMPAGNGWLWSHSSRQMQLRKLPTLQVVADLKQMQERIPALAPGWHGPPRVDTWQGNLIGTLKNGDQVTIDCETLKATPLDPMQIVSISGDDMFLGALEEAKIKGLPPLVGDKGEERSLPDDYLPGVQQRLALARIPKIRRFEHDYNGTVNDVHAPDGPLMFRSISGPKQALHVGPWRSAPRRLPASVAMLRPAFLGDGRTQLALQLPDHSVIVVHHRSLGKDAPLRFSRLSTSDGKLLWTIDERTGAVELGLLSDKLVTIVVRGSRSDESYAIGVDWRSGKVAWRYTI